MSITFIVVIIIFNIILLLLIIGSYYALIGLNKYITQLENEVQKNIEKTEVLEDNLRELVGREQLSENGTLKKQIIEK